MEIFTPFYFHPFRPLCQWADFRLGEFQRLKYYIFLNTNVCWQIQDGAKLYGSVDIRKLHGAKITPIQYPQTCLFQMFINKSYEI